MENALTNGTIAIILLCGVLSKNSSTVPLNQREYNQLVQWLMHQGLHPRDLIDSSHTEAAASGSGLPLERLNDLLNRGVQLALAVEQWQQKGLWIISRSDSAYPKRLKQHLPFSYFSAVRRPQPDLVNRCLDGALTPSVVSSRKNRRHPQLFLPLNLSGNSIPSMRVIDHVSTGFTPRRFDPPLLKSGYDSMSST